MIIRGDDIKRLIPQRDPFMMVDEFEQQDENTAMTALTVGRGNYFLLPDGMISPTGLIEHIAQSCSALAARKKKEEDTAPIGMIVEVKNFCCHRRVRVNERIETTVTFGFSFGNMTLAHGISKTGEETIAEVDLKIFMQ